MNWRKAYPANTFLKFYRLPTINATIELDKGNSPKARRHRIRGGLLGVRGVSHDHRPHTPLGCRVVCRLNTLRRRRAIGEAHRYFLSVLKLL